MVGHGKPVVLLHGGFSAAAAFLAQTQAIAEAGYRVHVPARRGHGHTPDVPGPFSYAAMAADTIGYLETQVNGPAASLAGAAVEVPPTCDNLWLRRSGADPWEYDVILTDIVAERWVYKRDPRISLPFSEIVWWRDEIPYLKPEIQLLHKTPGLRTQDQDDFDACRTLLDENARRWLRTALETAHPRHPWIAEL